jgi:uncharacterized protein (DUF4415 family)
MRKQRADAPDEENPQWTEAEIRGAMSFSELPESIQRAINNRKRGPQKAPKKVSISIRLSPDVAEGLRATGEGWQVRADEALRSWLQSAKGARPQRESR